ncbi:UNVERIFIED_CONTAM: hypothetical protein PYX00_003717 [Menopon gallinae]|uniref:Uncharacterized protein n=1 Tax=Menopon gallinae TaxID=328185 RepID=A0AAW2I319_9NEOP
MDKKRQSILKPEGRIPLQEMLLPDFPDEDTTTVTVTKSRRVSFGANFVKEFIVGSAVSAQFFSEYEQAVSSSDSSNANTSRSGLLDLSSVHEGGDALNLCVKHGIEDDFLPVRKKLCSENQPNICNEQYDRNNDKNWEFNIENDSSTFIENRNYGAKPEINNKNGQKFNKRASHINDSLTVKHFQNKKNESDLNSSKLSDCSEKKNKQGKFSSTICFSADSPSADMQFTEGCISLAKSIFDKKNKEMKVYIQAKPKENNKEEKRDSNGTILFEASEVEMSLTKCVINESKDDSYLSTAGGDVSSFLNDSNEDSEYVPLHMNLLNNVLDQDSDSIEGIELKRALFSPKKTLSEMLSSDSTVKSVFGDNDMSLEKDNNQECDMELVTCASMKIETHNESVVEEGEKLHDESGECGTELESSKMSLCNSGIDIGVNAENEKDPQEQQESDAINTSRNEENAESVKDVNGEECDMEATNCSSLKSICTDVPEEEVVKEEEPNIAESLPVEEEILTQNNESQIDEELKQSFFCPERSLTEMLNDCNDKELSLEKDANGDCELVSMNFETSAEAEIEHNNNSGFSSCGMSAVSLSTVTEDAKVLTQDCEVELSACESLKMECNDSVVDEIGREEQSSVHSTPRQSAVEELTTDDPQNLSVTEQSYVEGMSMDMQNSSDQSSTSISLWDRKIVLMLTEQSQEPNCYWKIEDLSSGEDAKNWVFSFPLLNSSAVATFRLEPPGKYSEESFSLITEKTISLQLSKEYQSEKTLKSTRFAFMKLKDYFRQECSGLDNAHKMPLFLDRLNLYLTKINGVVNQMLRILKEYPGSRLKESTLSFRLYSFPLMFSCSVMIDVSDPLRFSENSVTSEKHFGNFSTMLIKSVFKDCLKSEEVLIHFVRTLVQSVMRKERESGSVTNRSFIRLIA